MSFGSLRNVQTIIPKGTTLTTAQRSTFCMLVGYVEASVFFPRTAWLYMLEDTNLHV